MNISKTEQRVLHALAQGGAIRQFREDPSRPTKITGALCLTREGLILSDLTLALFVRLRARGLIESRAGGPYRISRRGRGAVRAQLDNR